MNSSFWSPLLLSLKLSFSTCFILVFLGIPLAYGLAHSRSRWKPLAETLVSLPLVLPPSVLGFYLLLALSPAGALGRWVEEAVGVRLAFSFTGILIGSLLFGLPFMVQPLQAGFESLPRSYREAAYSLGKSRMNTLVRVLLPNMRSSLLTGLVLTFAHTLGEFGVILMIGGSIPNETRVASIAIYDEVEALNYAAANKYAVILLALSFAILLALHTLNKHKTENRP